MEGIKYPRSTEYAWCYLPRSKTIRCRPWSGSGRHMLWVRRRSKLTKHMQTGSLCPYTANWYLQTSRLDIRYWRYPPGNLSQRTMNVRK